MADATLGVHGSAHLWQSIAPKGRRPCAARGALTFASSPGTRAAWRLISSLSF